MRSKSVSSNGLRRSGSPAFSLSGSKLNSPNAIRGISETPIARKLFSESTPNQGGPDNEASYKLVHKFFFRNESLLTVIAGSPTVATSSPSENVDLTQVNGSKPELNLLTYSYERLRVDSKDRVTDIDVTKREVLFFVEFALLYN